MAKAAELSHNNMMNKARYEVSLRDYFIERILREIPFSNGLTEAGVTDFREI